MHLYPLEHYLPGCFLDHTVYACTHQHDDYSELYAAAVSQVFILRLNGK